MTRLAFILILGMAISVVAADSPRERVSINDTWRFTRGDSNGDSPGLMYDLRQKVKGDDYTVADAEPTEAEKLEAAAARVLKRWVLPTGNPFIRDPAKRHVRPAEDPPVGDLPYVKREFDDRSWQQLNLPHDWAIEGPFLTNGPTGGMGRLKSWGVGWYRKKLDIPATDAGRCTFLEIEGAMSYAMVWLNGRLVGGWPYGYASWQIDLTPYMAPGGEAQLAIRLDNPPNSSRWYPGGGIYRNVWLTRTQPIHVGQWGTYLLTTNVSTFSATIVLEVTLANDSKKDATAAVSTEIFALNAAGDKVGDVVAKLAPADVSIAAASSAKTKGSFTLANPRLWGPPPQQQPNRYVAVTSVSQNGKLVDRYETRFGIRDVRFHPNKGLFVNGERIAIQGVNQHHDLGALGAAFNRRAAQRQLEILREMGCNAIRMSHNPPAPELLELTDQMGFLVVDEIFDCWYRKKPPLDFHLISPDGHEQDLRAMIRRDRNHPSVILWSVGNETGEQYTGEQGAAVAKTLCDIAHDEDASRPATFSINYAKPDMPMPAVADVISLNYQGEGIRDTPEFEGTQRVRTPPLYRPFHEKFPDKAILSSESAAALSTRGEYLFPVAKGISSSVKDGQGGDSKKQIVSAYELYAADFGSSADKVFTAQDKHSFVAGEFVWTGWDYLGEPTPYYGARSSYFGIIDLAGFKKDRFYLYQSRWRPHLPMAHILPHWTWPERIGQVTPVHVFTSGDEAELFLNGRSLGRKKKILYEYRLRWDDATYQPGELKVIAYKGGKEWATDVLQTADAPARVEMSPDRAVIRADGLDLSFVTVCVVDKKGIIAPRSRNRIKFQIEGPGKIIATDNGDPRDFTPFPSHERDAFNGRCVVIVRAKAGQPGTITLKAEADGLQNRTSSITTTPAS